MKIRLSLPLMALVRRELLRSLRQARPFVLLVILTLACSAFVIGSWPRDHSVPRQAADASDLILGSAAFILLTALGLLIPAYGATSLTSEREEQTHDMLSLTLIRPFGVVIGKLLNVLGVYFILVVAAAPIIATLFFLVGVDWPTFVGVLVILSATALSCACVAVLCSAMARRTNAAIGLSYFCTICIMGLAFLPIVWVVEVFDFDEGILMFLAPVMSPGVAIALLVEGRQLLPVHVSVAALYHVIVALIALFIAWWVVRRPKEPEMPEFTTPGRRRRFREKVRLLFRGAPGRHALMGDRCNPIFLREMRYPIMTRRAARRRLFLGMFCLTLVVSLATLTEAPGGNWTEDFVAMLMAGQMVVVCVISASIAANTLTKERDRGNLDMIHMTLMSPAQIVLGKARAGMQTAFIVLLGGQCATLVLLPTLWGHSKTIPLLITGLVSLSVCVILSVSLGVLASALAHRTVTAVLFSYVLSAWVYFLMCLAFFAAAGLIVEVLGIWQQVRGIEDEYVEFWMWWSPAIAYFYNGFDGGRNDPVFTLYWFGNIFTNLAISAGILALAVHVFWLKQQRNR